MKKKKKNTFGASPVRRSCAICWRGSFLVSSFNIHDCGAQYVSGSFQKAQNSFSSAGGHSVTKVKPAAPPDLRGQTRPPRHRLGLHAATRLPANQAWLLIIGHVAQFARRNKKEEESHSSQMRQTGTGAEIDANVQLAKWLFSWATKGTNGKGFERGDIGSNQSGQELLLNVKRLLFFPFSYSSLWTQPTTTPFLFFLWCKWCY